MVSGPRPRQNPAVDEGGPRARETREALETEAIDDLILGRGVRRGRHPLPAPLQPLFLARLAANGFSPAPVAEIDVAVGVRVPAWVVTGEVADFGTVFWEIFTETKRRKLFGSEARNAKGDWDVLLPAGSPRPVWAAPGLAESYDASRPVGMY